MTNPTGKAVLIILDGFGIGKDSPFNAIQNAGMEFYSGLLKNYPHSQIMTHGEWVGLPDGIMGNSEVGHMTMGAGRIIYQDLVRISKSIQDKSFFKNEVLKKTLQAGAAKTGRVHLMGLVSDGGVHSDLSHLLALLDLCCELKIPNVSVHVFLDGRDTHTDSGRKYVETLLQHKSFEAPSKTHAVIATIMGRYWAMDRDKRWDRTQRAYDAITGTGEFEGSSKVKEEPLQIIASSYSAKKMDEFVEPVLLDPAARLQDGDSVVFFNFRSDRARQLTVAITRGENMKAGKVVDVSAYACMTEYDQTFQLPVAFSPDRPTQSFGKILESNQLKQFRIAETEKYAHVTFFFNGGREAVFQGEDRILIPSPKDVATYDLKPEMSAYTVADEAVKRIESGQYHFVLMNFANPDMIGHTGNYEAALKALKVIDECLARVIGAAQKNGYHVLLTADHGNVEEMRHCNGGIHTQHTTNPVPAIWIAPGTAIAPKNSRKSMKDGGLADIMPTLANLMGLPLPKEVTGHSLI